ncbi:MAG TPA: DMT family transporter [Gemmatimonadaceae bacterium]|nr:DMT family transporter [Gemmatimonadaceae bacterium]
MSSGRHSIFRATLLVAFSACCFGSLTTVTLLAMHAGLSLVNVIFWRFFLAAGFLLVISWRSQREYPLDRTAWRLMAIGGIGQAIISYLSFKALDYLPVGTLAFLFYTYPAWVAVISALRRRELLTKPRFIALVMAMSGIAIMVESPSAKALSAIGVLMALGTAFLYALYLPMIHDAQGQLPAFLSSFYIVSGIAITFFVVSVVTGELEVPARPNVWAYLLILAIVGTVLAFGGLMAGLRILGPVRTSIIATVEPFFTAILGATILKQGLTIAIIGGGALIAAAVIVLEQSSVRAEPDDA